MNLRDANIPPQIANAVIGLFSDPVAVTKMQEEFEKQRQEVQKQLNDFTNKKSNNKINEQNNKNTKINEIQNQEQ